MSEQATARQLWTINDLAIKLGKEFSLPLTKDEASLIVGQLKIEEKNSFPKTIGELAELARKDTFAKVDKKLRENPATQEEYWAKTRQN